MSDADLKPIRNAATPEGPPDYRVVGRHGLFPDTSHDEIERINYLAQMNRHLAARVMPGVKAAYETRVEPAFGRAYGRGPTDRHEVRKALLGDPAFQTWSALRRLTMEQRQQAGRWTTLRQRSCRSRATSRRSITTACRAATMPKHFPAT